MTRGERRRVIGLAGLLDELAALVAEAAVGEQLRQVARALRILAGAPPDAEPPDGPPATPAPDRGGVH